MIRSHLQEALATICDRSAAAVVGRARTSSPGLNSLLRRRLSSAPGDQDSFLAQPIFEAARIWQPAAAPMGSLAGNLLHRRLVDALDQAPAERMPTDRYPYLHQLEAWQASKAGFSCLVTSGTGSGKTETFMVPILDDLLADSAKGRLCGVRAIIIYPLNALIESQRERLAAWTERLQDRISFALYNGDTPETSRQVKRRLAAAELGDRKSIRDTPPSILITNVTMLEYLLLRSKDLPIIERSQGLLRWIVLDEAHGYVGAQAAEMALLLRRVRSAFGVRPEDVRLMATSATISEGNATETKVKLTRFLADLAGKEEASTRIIEGKEQTVQLPSITDDEPLVPSVLSKLAPGERWGALASHPRIRMLRDRLRSDGLTLREAAKILLHDESRVGDAQVVLDLVGETAEPAKPIGASSRLLPWRSHLFHRSQGGIWACVDPSCEFRDQELKGEGANWSFGAVYLAQRDSCSCGGPVFEVVTCSECGTPHLIAGRTSGHEAKLVPNRSTSVDEFSVDEEPQPDEQGPALVHDTVWLRPGTCTSEDRYVCAETSRIFDNSLPDGTRAYPIRLIEDPSMRACCANASSARLQSHRYGAAFFMGTTLPELLETLAEPINAAGLPMGGRRAISFTDSRQGVARLAAKLQQDAERTLTRAYVYHSVQGGTGLSADERQGLETKLAKYRAFDPEEFADEIAALEEKLSNRPAPIRWPRLIETLSSQPELRDFAAKVWEERDWGGREMAQNPSRLASMFLYRELFRRPRIQNNVETMGLARLTFPDLETRAISRCPSALREAGWGPEAWLAVAQAAVDFIFRDNFAVNIQDDQLARWINPRQPGRRSVFSSNTPRDQVTERYAIFWPTARCNHGKIPRLVKLIYILTKGSPESQVDQDRVQEVLDELWRLLTATVAKDCGRGAWRLAFEEAAVARLEQAWVCPVTRRIISYSPGGMSPYAPDDPRGLEAITLPKLPVANPLGILVKERGDIASWLRDDETIDLLRRRGLWTDLNDRVALYPPFLRSQEHSAQITRPVLQFYEERFKAGEINLLNCSTTMEMGVDIPNVTLVANSNVPPSVSNYRQRVGRAGRRGEPWAFAITFCRDLPLDHVVFDDPRKFLKAPIAAPAVRLNSLPLVKRHVNAFLLGAFIRGVVGGLDIKVSIGAFIGASIEDDDSVKPTSQADNFLAAVRSETFIEAQSDGLRSLLFGTPLEGTADVQIAAETAVEFESLVSRWRSEYDELIERAKLSDDEEVKVAFGIRAKRMHGEFLLSELARRGFTPSYGFPVDVVTFDHLSGTKKEKVPGGDGRFGEYQGAASRTLDVAIREYAPGADVVIDGLVHQSEGIRPAWSAMADVSGLEDLQFFWECRSCRDFGINRTVPSECPSCSLPELTWHRTLRPTGFLGRKAPHTGYESLAYIPFEIPRISAAGSAWQALPDPAVGRMRAHSAGRVVIQSSGQHGYGVALCLCCGRSEAETDEQGGAVPPSLARHKPLAPIRAEEIVRGYCPGGFVRPERLQRNVRFAHETHTDVFELQLPENTTREASLAFVAGLREALAERLGAEAKEIGIATAASNGPSTERRLSVFLYDKAAGGAGLSTRLGEFDWFKACLKTAVDRWLCCSEDCEHGCPSCILRPDLSFGEYLPDRRDALRVAQEMLSKLEIPEDLKAFGQSSTFLGSAAANWLLAQQLRGKLSEVTIYLHGTPAEWDFGSWALSQQIANLAEKGVHVTVVVPALALTDRSFDMSRRLSLYAIAAKASLGSIDALPNAGGHPLLLLARNGREAIGVVSTDVIESVPGLTWGAGERAPLVCGLMSGNWHVRQVSAEKLIQEASGNAQLLWLDRRLDGAASKFGDRFWQLLEQAAPLLVASIANTGVTSVEYNDRYLVTPLSIRLLYETLRATPGVSPQTKIIINSAYIDRVGTSGAASTVFHSYREDSIRIEVLSRLFPSADVNVTAKKDQPHARSMTIRLADGRSVKMLFDQGFGAWRFASGSSRHPFQTPPAAQAKSIKDLVFDIVGANEEGAPLIAELI